MRRAVSRAFVAAAVALSAAWLGGCAAPGGGRDIVTASDETDADRRARARFELAVAYYQQGQSETALDEVKQAIAARPNFGAAYNLRGLIYGSMGQNELADESFRRAIQIDARDADAMHNYAWFHCQNGSYTQAESWFTRALAVPQYRGTARTLLAQGLCQARAQRLADAERSLTRSYEIDASNTITAYHLADLLFKRGDIERARFYVRRALGSTGTADAQTLWLAARIEVKARNRAGADTYGRELRRRFPQSREAAAYDRGQFDE